VNIPDESYSKTIRLGGYMPNFSINFLDKNKNSTIYEGDVEIKIECQELTVKRAQGDGTLAFRVRFYLLLLS